MSNIKKIALLALLAILIALPWMIGAYSLQVVILTITYSILALCFAFTFKVGLPRFDIAAWWAIGAYSTAILMTKAHLTFWPSMLIGGLLAVVLGWIVFIFAIPRGMMVFLLFGMVLVMAIKQLFGSVQFFGGWSGIQIDYPTLGPLTFINKPELYYMGLFLLIVTVIVFYLLYNSKIGRAWNAIGSSLNLASSLGINIVRYRMANVLIGNFFIAIAGGYLIAYTLVAVPDSFGLHESIYVMMYAVVGGLGHPLSGPITGALIITLIPEYLRTARQYEPIITGIIIVLIIIFLPKGIFSIYNKYFKTWFFHLLGKAKVETKSQS